MLSIVVLMELKIYFDTKFVLLTDCKGTKKIENFYICNDNSTLLQAIDSLAQEAHNSAVLYNTNFDFLLNLFKSNYTYIEAAGGFIKNEFNEYLFIYRREKWDLPKGKLEKGETPEVAALREVAEETGLQNVIEKNYRCSTWHTYEMYGQKVLKQTYWFDMEAEKNQKSAPQTEEEITELQWLSEDKFPQVFANTFPSIITVINKE